MSLQSLVVPTFTVAGRINAGAFQKAKAIATGCDAFASATVLDLTPTEYSKLLVKLGAQFGGPAYLHEAGVAVYSDVAGFIGDDAQLVKWLTRNSVGGVAEVTNSHSGKGTDWDKLAEMEYQTLLCESARSFVYLTLSTEGEGVLGRLVFELFPELAPTTCANFVALCEMESGGYVGTAIHRVKAGGWMQGGDTVSGNGDGGSTASGNVLPDESFHMKHAELGILGMANSGTPHSAKSQFYVTFDACPSFDEHYVAFGKLVDGHSLLKFIEEMDVANERPRMNLHCSSAGRVVPVTEAAFYADEDEAATKLQAMHKGRLKRREIEERKAAAKRVQAAKRGQQARKEAREQKEAAVKMQAITRGRKERSKKSKAT